MCALHLASMFVINTIVLLHERWMNEFEWIWVENDAENRSSGCVLNSFSRPFFIASIHFHGLSFRREIIDSKTRKYLKRNTKTQSFGFIDICDALTKRTQIHLMESNDHRVSRTTLYVVSHFSFEIEWYCVCTPLFWHGANNEINTYLLWNSMWEESSTMWEKRTKSQWHTLSAWLPAPRLAPVSRILDAEIAALAAHRWKEKSIHQPSPTPGSRTQSEWRRLLEVKRKCTNNCWTVWKTFGLTDNWLFFLSLSA